MSMGLSMIQGSVHPHFDVDEMAGLNDCTMCDPNNRPGPVDMFTMPLPNYALSGEMAENPMMDVELSVVPNTGSLAGVFDFLKPAKVKAPKATKLKKPAPAPFVPPAPAPKINSFVDQYGKYVVVGVGAVAIVAVIALLMTSQKKG